MPSHRHRPRAASAKPRPFVTPPERGHARHSLERRLALWVSYLAALPRSALWVVVAAVFLAGAFAPGAGGGAALLAIAVALAALAFVTWPAAAPPARVLRVLVVAGVVLWAVTKLR